ncbi:MAG: hypothetical protein ACK4F6_07025 [Hylemonella sp.]
MNTVDTGYFLDPKRREIDVEQISLNKRYRVMKIPKCAGGYFLDEVFERLPQIQKLE